MPPQSQLAATMGSRIASGPFVSPSEVLGPRGWDDGEKSLTLEDTVTRSMLLSTLRGENCKVQWEERLGCMATLFLACIYAVRLVEDGLAERMLHMNRANTQ